MSEEPTSQADVQRQVERDNMRELIASMEEANGPADPAAVEAKQALLRDCGDPTQAEKI
jgi:hypothetical protein